MNITVNERLIRLADHQYPITLDEVRQENPQCLFGELLSEEDALSLGYAVVQPVERPVNDVVVEQPPVEQDGVWHQSFNARAFTDKELAARLMDQKVLFISQLESRRDAELGVGFPYTLHDRTFHVQLRLVDRLNLMALKGEADYYVGTNDADQLMEFRPFENQTVWLGADEFVDMAQQALKAMKGVYAKMWALKDQVDNATAVDQFPAMPESFFG